MGKKLENPLPRDTYITVVDYSVELGDEPVGIVDVVRALGKRLKLPSPLEWRSILDLQIFLSHGSERNSSRHADWFVQHLPELYGK